MRRFYTFCLLLFVFFILVSKENISKAYSLDDFFAYADQINSMNNVPSLVQNVVSSCLSNETLIRNTLSNYIGDNDISIVCGTSRSTASKFIHVNLTSKTLSLPNNTMQTPRWDYKFYLTTDHRCGLDGTNVNGSDLGKDRCFGLYMTNSVIDDWSGWYLQNQFVEPYNGPTFTPFNNVLITVGGITNIHQENFSRTVSQWRLGTLSNYNEYTKGFIEIYNGEDNLWSQVSELFWDSNGAVYVNNIDLIYYQLYRIYFLDTENYVYSDNYGYYFLPIGVNYSGESAINNLNYDNIQPILKQNQDNNNFWKNTYNSLFTMNSGDINDIALLAASYFPSGENNPISIYDTIFGSYSNEPDDFIIRWDDHPLFITWNNGEVLYSGDFIKAR